MSNSKNITDTGSRLLVNLNNVNEQFYQNQRVDDKITNAVLDSMVKTGVMLKYYPSLNKSLIRLDNGKEVVCKNLSLFGGDLLFFYTPVGDATYCDLLHEPCVVPRGRLDVIVAPLDNNDDKEWIMMGYYHREDIVGVNPSKQGNFKILALGSLQEYSLRFGIDGLEVVTNGKVNKTEVNDFGEDVSDYHYTKDETDNIVQDASDSLVNILNEDYYTKNELDTIIQGLSDNEGNVSSGSISAILEQLLDNAIEEEDSSN